MEQQLFTIKEVCAILRVSRPTVYEMIRAGRIQRVYIGKSSPWITRESLERYLESLKQPGAAPKESKKGLGSVLERFGLKLGQT
jgi:excisionase family DNA binding protein